MEHPFYHLAQLNIAHMRGASIDDPVMSGFVAQIAAMNAAAEQHPGFIWRLTTPAGEDTGAYPDPTILVNLSVWRDIEALRDFTYHGIHKGPVKDRAQWFHRPTQAHLALWWIPAGHIPSVQEAVERLDHLRHHGPTPAAFPFAQPAPAPDSPTSPESSPPINLDNRIFTTAANTSNGDVNAATRFHYRQQGARVWATYSGGNVRFGALTAVWTPTAQLDMRYHHTTQDATHRTGRCLSTPSPGPGPLTLQESWQWTNGDLSSGQSVLTETSQP
ncbi:MAG: DUF3291 domain-containing protein [Bryobacterales bacterium]|nr:DUF3291 domain-containing protein [Bryobacterales bacterium]